MEFDGNVMRVQGRLTLETSPALFAQGLPVKDGLTDIVIDLAKVEGVDSSAISLMLAWLRAAQAKQLKLSFVNVPENLISLANLYDVTETLSLPANN
ncbi:MAG: STAS domain-containing protein [Gallionellaceae bacterium]